jgi:hypothetical protein
MHILSAKKFNDFQEMIKFSIYPTVPYNPEKYDERT